VAVFSLISSHQVHQLGKYDSSSQTIFEATKFTLGTSSGIGSSVQIIPHTISSSSSSPLSSGRHLPSGGPLSSGIPHSSSSST